MIKELKRETRYKEIEEVIYLNVNDKTIKVYTYQKQDNLNNDYGQDIEVDKEDLNKLTVAEEEELDEYLVDYSLDIFN